MQKKKIDMLNGSLWDKILLFALPVAASGILQQLFNAADVAVVGQFVGKEAMAAVGANASVINIFVTLFTGIALGANVVISRYTGRGNQDMVEKGVHTAILVAIISGIGVTIIGELSAPAILSLMNVPSDILSLAVIYLRVYMLGMPVILLYNFLQAIYSSQGDTRTPLMALTISGVCNVILNMFFVIILRMNVVGVALATVLANVISSSILFYLLKKGKLPIQIHASQFRIDGNILKKMIQIGLPAGIQGMVFSVSNIVVQTALNSLGTDVVAGSSAAFNIEILGFFVVNSFSQATTTFIGQNYGAGKLDRCQKTLYIALFESVIFGGGLSLLLIIFGRQLLAFFNSDPTVIEYGYIRIFWILAFEIVNGAIDIFSGAMRGYGESMLPAIVSLVGITGVRITWVYTYFQTHQDFQSLIYAYPLSWCVTLFVMVIVYCISRKRGMGKSVQGI